MARILLDECVNARLRHHLPGHFVSTVPRQQWASRKDGSLLGFAQREFDVFVTVDRRLIVEQDVSRLTLGVILLRPRRGPLEFLLPLVPRLLAALETIRPGEVVTIEAE